VLEAVCKDRLLLLVFYTPDNASVEIHMYRVTAIFTISLGAFFLIGAGVILAPTVSIQTKEKTVKVLFVGDLMFDRTVRQVAEEKGNDFIFSCLKETLDEHDLVVANLEGPITTFDSVSVGSTPGGEGNYTFTFPESLAGTLAKHGIKAVSLGNNHSLNFGAEGIIQTKEFLNKAGVAFFGNPLDAENTSVTSDINEVPLTLISFNEFGLGGSTTEDTLEAIKGAESFNVVFAHWGNEYTPTSVERQRDWAHKFIDAGADLVIGAHPHVVQENEVYKGVKIYYSLGNFVMDQYWEEAVRNGLALSIEMSPKGIKSIKEIPLTLGRDRRTCVSI